MLDYSPDSGISGYPFRGSLPVDDWLLALQQGKTDLAWDRFIEQHRGLIFTAIRQQTRDPDEVMDVFARVCEALREQNFRRLRKYVEQSGHRARLSTWLVTVVRNLAIDLFRQRHGRERPSVLVEKLPPLQRRIFDLIFLERRSHVEAYEFIRQRDAPELSFRQFLGELRLTYSTIGQQGPRHLLSKLSDAPPPDLEDAGLSAEEYIERRRLLDKALSTLEVDERIAVQLYVEENLPAADVARILGLPNVKAVYNRVYRALAQLREMLEGAGLGREDV